MKTWHTLTALAAIAAGVVTIRAVDQHRNDAEVERLRADVASLSIKVAEPRREEHPERPPLRVMTAPEPDPKVQAGPAKVADGATAEIPPAPSSLQPEEVREQMEVRFAQERPDPTWSPKARTDARRGLEQTLPETSTLRAIECRETMCRFETAHHDLDHYRQFVQAAFMDPNTHLWNGGFFTTLVSDPRTDQVIVVSYLARDGEELSLTPTLQ